MAGIDYHTNMMRFFQNRPFFSLIALVVTGAVIGTLHNRAMEAGNPFLIHDVSRSVLAPSELAFRTVFAVGGQAAAAFRSRSALLRENATLREQVGRLRRENAMLRQAARENTRLRVALALRRMLPFQMVAAEVISRNESNWFDTATLNCGRRAAIAAGDAVIDDRGRLIGQILQVDPFTSQLVALTDSKSAVGAMVRRSRSCGMLRGQGGDYLILCYLPSDADVRVNDAVVSSGRGRVVPKGLLIGWVERVVRERSLGTTSALVRPGSRFDEIEQVFIVKPERD